MAATRGDAVTSARTDRWGSTLQCGKATGVPYFNDAVEGLLGLSGEPTQLAEMAVRHDQDLVLGHVLRAYLSLYGTSADGVRAANKLLKPLEEIDSTLGEREILHLRAARAWAAGEWDEATRCLERALLHDSHDLLALKVAQDLYFLLGQTTELQGVVSRVLRAWSADRLGWGYVQGMYAFGLEENGDYGPAEIFARAALHYNPLDTWARHALAHVLEMEGRQQAGITFLRESEGYWSSGYFSVHTWWHLSLYYLELGQIDETLALYDGSIRATRTMAWLDVVDAASLLWRLALFGADVGERVLQLAADIEQLVDEPTYIFNDWHAVMVFGLSGLHERNEQILTSNRRRAHGTNRVVAQQAGLALLEGFDAFAAGRPGRAVDLLTDLRPFAPVVGGSNAQRDIIELTLIAALARLGDLSEAERVVAQRVARRPNSATTAHHLLLANTAGPRGTVRNK